MVLNEFLFPWGEGDFADKGGEVKHWLRTFQLGLSHQRPQGNVNTFCTQDPERGLKSN